MTIKKPLMRLDGEPMIIRIKDAVKLIGIVIMCACAVLVCTLFFNSNIDLARVSHLFTDPDALLMYDLTRSSANLTSAVTGGALGMTTVIMLFFYIKHYIDTHKPELGILKALGYSNLRIAMNFWVFGLSVCLGTSLGFGVAFAFMPKFYKDMRSDGYFGEVTLHFNPELIVYLIVLPTLLFSVLSILYGWYKLKRPVLELMSGKARNRKRKRAPKYRPDKDLAFLKELKNSTVRSRLSLVFFIGFASFCYAATIVMSFSIEDLAAGGMMAVMMAGIGLVLAVTTLFIAVMTLIKGNAKTIAMMRVTGYSDRECSKAILDGYRPLTYFGFALGTIYQYGLMQLMIAVFFGNSVLEVPEYHFPVKAFIFALLSFIAIYEIFMKAFAGKLKRMPLKEIMLEE